MLDIGPHFANRMKLADIVEGRRDASPESLRYPHSGALNAQEDGERRLPASDRFRPPALARQYASDPALRVAAIRIQLQRVLELHDRLGRLRRLCQRVAERHVRLRILRRSLHRGGQPRLGGRIPARHEILAIARPVVEPDGTRDPRIRLERRFQPLADCPRIQRPLECRVGRRRAVVEVHPRERAVCALLHTGQRAAASALLRAPAAPARRRSRSVRRDCALRPTVARTTASSWSVCAAISAR